MTKSFSNIFETNRKQTVKRNASPSKSIVEMAETIEIDAKRMLESIQANHTIIPHGLTSEEMIEFIENN